MAYEKKPGELGLFPATEKDKERAGPDLVLTGSGKDLSGQDCFISVFRATNREGEAVQTKDGKQVYNVRLKAKTGGQSRPAEPESDPFMDDADAPF